MHFINNNHFVFSVTHCTSATVFYFDTFNKSASKPLKDMMLSALDDPIIAQGKKFTFKEVRLETTQKDSYNCGPMVLCIVLKLMRGLPLQINATDIPSFRAWLAENVQRLLDASKSKKKQHKPTNSNDQLPNNSPDDIGIAEPVSTKHIVEGQATPLSKRAVNLAATHPIVTVSMPTHSANVTNHANVTNDASFTRAIVSNDPKPTSRTNSAEGNATKRKSGNNSQTDVEPTRKSQRNIKTPARYE